MPNEYTFRYRVRNWSSCNRALIAWGRLTFWFDEQAVLAWRAMRDASLGRIEELGRYKWRVSSDCTRQGLAENAVSRFPARFGSKLSARRFDNQRAEAIIKCTVLNRMTSQGMPESVRSQLQSSTKPENIRSRQLHPLLLAGPVVPDALFVCCVNSGLDPDPIRS